MSHPAVPRMAAWLLWLTQPRGVRRAVLEDMAEEFGEVAARLGESRARRWYWGQVLGSLRPGVRWPRLFRGPVSQPNSTNRKGLSVMNSQLWQDVRYGIRNTAGRLGFSSVIVLTLALAIGATTAIFSVVDGIMLRPLPFHQPDRLVSVWADYTERGGPIREWLSYPNFHDLRQERAVFQEVALYNDWYPTVTGEGDPEQITVGLVTHGMFSIVLPQPPELGRGFTAADDEPGSQSVVLLSHGFWQRRFSGDPEVIGQTLLLDETPNVIIGVMPEGFRPPFVSDADMWATMQMNETQFAGSRASARFRGLARLADGVILEQARARANDLGARLAAEYPRENTGVGYALFPLHADLVHETATSLWLLLGAVVFVLLIACVNIANLLLARAANRRTELAVRAALGAGRGRIVRQLLTEYGVLALCGGVLGLALSAGGVKLLLSLAPPDTPRLEAVGLDLRVMGFALATTVLATLIFGLLPALRSARPDLQSSLKAGGRGGDGAAHGKALRSGLVVGQMALALMLLVGAGLMVRTLQALGDVELGFDPTGVLAVRLNLPSNRYQTPEQRSAFFRSLESQLAATPGVGAVGSNSNLPLSGSNGDVDFVVEGQPIPEPGNENILWFRRTTPGYFDAIGIEIIRGRGITAADDFQAPRVLVINQTMAERYFPDRDPIGQRININSHENPVWREIVGVAADVKNFGLALESRNAAYFPYHQVPSTRMSLAVRAAEGRDAGSVLPAVRAAVAELDPALATTNAEPLEAWVSQSLQAERFVTSLLGGFAAVAFFLATLGLYGVVSYGVNQRMRELGLRLALGADGGSIRRLVMGGSMALALGGVSLGIAGSLALGRVMAGLLFEVSPTDPVTLGSVAAVLLLVAGGASLLPAERAVRVDPISVLKEE